MDGRIRNAIGRRATIVTASRRLARALREEYNAAQQALGSAAWEAPAIQPWSGWLNGLWEEFLYTADRPPVRIGEWPETAIWERVVAEAPESADLLQSSAAAAAAREAWALAIAWRLDLNNIASLGNEDARAFAGWAARFRAICEEEGWLEDARLPDCLAAAAKQIRLPEGVLLAGFDEFTPQQREFLDACSAAGCAIEEAKLRTESTEGKAARVPFPDAEQELTAAARWARGLVERGETNLGVVVPDLAVRRNQAERTFRAVLDAGSQLPGGEEPFRMVNFSAGPPLAGYPLIRSALAVLSLSPSGNSWEQVSAFLRAPYLGGSDAERAARGLLDARVREEGDVKTSIARLRNLCREAPGTSALEQILQGMMELHNTLAAKQPAAEWSRTFSALLQAAGWPGEQPLSSAEYQTVQAWGKLLSEVAATDAVNGPIECGAALALAGRVARQTMFQPETSDAPIQLMGALEASGLRFSHLWVTGMHDGVWPPPPAPNPFLPVRMQRALRIPHSSAERELEFAGMVTERLLASAPDVVLSYPTRDGDCELSPSPLILGVPREEPRELTLWQGPDYLDEIRRSRQIEVLADEQAPPLGVDAWQRGGAKVFQYQSVCPFRAFAELRLGAEELESPQPGLDPRERGVLVHSALEEVWKELGDHASLCARTDVAEVIARAAGVAVARLEQDRGAPIPKQFAALERDRLKRLVAEWLEIEKARTPFSVVQPEGERYAEVGGIRFRVKIDRIDRLPDGRELIIDYKTGTPSVHAWETDRPEEPQLPLYGSIHEPKPAGILFGQVKTGDSRFKGLVDETVVIPGADSLDLTAQVEAWRRVLLRLGSEFREGHAEAAPENPDKACRRCTLAGLCRIGDAHEWGVEEDER